MSDTVSPRVPTHFSQPVPGLCGKVRLHLFSVFVLLPVLLGMTGNALGQVQGASLPFTIQKNGGISMKDVLKLTRRPAGKDRITDEALELIKASNPTRYDREFIKMNSLTMPPRGDLYADSQILGAEGIHTVVPVEAILFVPERLKSSLLDSPIGDLILWPGFFAKNSSWIFTHEVSLEIANGEKEISETMKKSLARTDRVVVAVYMGFPISVMPHISDSGSVSGADQKTNKTSTRSL